MEKRTFGESNSNPTQKAVAMVTPKVSGAVFCFVLFYFFHFGKRYLSRASLANQENTLVAARATTQRMGQRGGSETQRRELVCPSGEGAQQTEPHRLTVIVQSPQGWQSQPVPPSGH